MYGNTVVVMDGCEKAAVRCCDGLAGESSGSDACCIAVIDGRGGGARCLLLVRTR
jgi:hypothetical protein